MQTDTLNEDGEPTLKKVAIWVCEPCLKNEPGVCHTPGCIQIRRKNIEGEFGERLDFEHQYEELPIGDDATREKLADILGLETDQDGDQDMLLIRDENDRVVEGIHFSAALDEIMQLISTHTASKVDAEREKFVAMLGARRDEITPFMQPAVVREREYLNSELDELISQLSPRKEEDL